MYYVAVVSGIPCDVFLRCKLITVGKHCLHCEPKLTAASIICENCGAKSFGKTCFIIKREFLDGVIIRTLLPTITRAGLS